MIIDTHAHFTPQPTLDALHRALAHFPSIELLHEGDDYRLAFAGGAPTRPLSARLRDGDHRLEWMTGQGLDVQVTGGWLDSFGYQLPPAEGLAWSRFLNEHLAAATAGIDRLVPLATVPLQDGRAAATVVAEAVAAGFAGVMIGTQPKGGEGMLDDADLDPFWEAAAGLGVTVYVHPMFGCGDPRLLDYDMINAVGRGVDTTTAVARLLFSGHLERYAGMRLVLSHGGGAIPYMLGRLARNHDIHPGRYADPVAGFRRLYFDSVLFDAGALRFLCGCAGPERVMLGSDYPFPIGDPDPTRVVRDADLGEPATRRILGDTARELFGIDAPG
jgi:aminocarboxymuconate-semialdehyde decarboxylase